MKQSQIKRLNDRLDALETCLLTMTELRGYLRKAENNCCNMLSVNFLEYNSYKEEIEQIDSFLTYLFAQEEHYRKIRDNLK